MKKAEKRIEWRARFDAWKASGLSVAEWCRDKGLKNHQMYYWINKFEDDSDPTEKHQDVQWLGLNMESESIAHMNEASVFIHVGELSVEVRPGANMELLSDVVQVLQKP
jgi:transposase-like protein